MRRLLRLFVGWLPKPAVGAGALVLIVAIGGGWLATNTTGYHISLIPLVVVGGWIISPALTIPRTVAITHPVPIYEDSSLSVTPRPHLSVRLHPLPAGVHHSATATLTTSVALWRWRAKRRVTFAPPLFVSPRPAPTASPTPRSDGEADEPSSLRLYVPGDPLRHVAWRIAAKRSDRTLVVRDEHGGRHVRIVAERGHDGATRTLRAMLDALNEGNIPVLIRSSGETTVLSENEAMVQAAMLASEAAR